MISSSLSLYSVNSGKFRLLISSPDVEEDGDEEEGDVGDVTL